jgi:hypothetical protein
LEELGGPSDRDIKQKWWSMLNWYVRNQKWNPGRAAHLYKEKFGVWPRSLHDMPEIPDKEITKFVDNSIRKYVRSIRRSR